MNDMNVGLQTGILNLQSAGLIQASESKQDGGHSGTLQR